ncbi:tetratricopeptide repeat protein [bacterium]|nr:tetratricopeptide repeat protein [bacterium]
MARTVSCVLLTLLAGCQTIASLQTSEDAARAARLRERLSRLELQNTVVSENSAQAATSAPLQEAVELMQAGRDEDALTVLARILQEDPENVAAIRLTATTARRLGDWRLQNAALQQLIDQNDNSPLVLNQCGRLLLQSLPQVEPSTTGSSDASQLTDKALAALRRSVELAPNNPRFAQELFVALAERGHDAEAEAVLSQAIRNCPQDSLLPMAAARYFEAQGRWADAVHQYDTALQISPRNRLWRRQRGICHARLQHWDKACDDLQPALRDTPVEPQMTEFLVWADAAFHAERFAAAIEILDVLREDADYRTPETEVLRVRCLTKLRQFDTATDATLQAVIDWPQHAGLRQLAAELEQSPSVSS